MNSTKQLWVTLIVLLVASFGVLLWSGRQIEIAMPPVPERVVSESGETIYTRDEIQRGRQVWQSIGGQQLGSIWGHGGLVAPDWSADWLHREIIVILDQWAEAEHGSSWAELGEEDQNALQGRLRARMRQNTYDPQTGTVTLTDYRAQAIRTVSSHYESLFGNDPATAELREGYAMRNNTIAEAEDRRLLGAFFWWTAWSAATERPNSNITYTNNWPSEPLIGNRPPASMFLWSAFSVTFLLAGIAALGWHYARTHAHDPEPHKLPTTDPLRSIVVTPSMIATAKYFWVVLALFLFQILLGALTAHYQVEGQLVYGYEMAEIFPYSITRTWHTQLGIFWIATSWLATGLFVAPAVSGYEPKGQRLGVNLLFAALLLVVVGSLTGEWLSIQQKLGANWFWFGTQGYEYVDLGRFWQILLFIGLTFWLGLMWRALRPALAKRDESRPLLLLFTLASIAIPTFYGAGLMYGQRSHLLTTEYWRWWVVHLWVEGFFEVFATVVIAFLFTRLRLLSVATATKAALFSTVIFLTGGIIGTFHHMYFATTTPVVMALGAVFSALEIVPLVLVGQEAWENIRLSRVRDWVANYKWPIYFFVAVAFWNFVGAGLFGFLINPPVALYYMQGLNTTPVHGHTALFGVYGMLGIGLLLFCLRGMKPDLVWNERILKTSFWCFNIGLAGMALLTLLPLGTMQLLAAINNGYWYARSEQFMQQPFVDLLIWMRVPGDTIFSIGALTFALFVAMLWLRPRRESEAIPAAEPKQPGIEPPAEANKPAGAD
jgi:nitric oxide reductase subunit B